MTLLTDAVRAMIGIASDVEVACDLVEAGAVRRHAQATMDPDPAYALGEPASGRYGGPIAPPLFPLHMFRRPLESADPFEGRRNDPDFDGAAATSAQGLPPLPVGNLALLNGGLEIELIRYARHGETVTARSRYADITERMTSKGPMLLVTIETEFKGSDGGVLLRSRKTLIRR